MNRGQAYTLEGIIGAIVIASALVIGLQAVDPAPWTQTDPTNPEELRTQSQDLLDAASDSGALHTAIRCSDDGTPPSGEAFMEGTGLANLTANTLPTENYRISVEYVDSNGDRHESVVVAGRPGRTSATVTRQVAIFDSDAVLTFDGDECDQPTLDPETLGESAATDFYIDDQHPGSELYAVITVRVIVW